MTYFLLKIQGCRLIKQAVIGKLEKIKVKIS